MRRLRTAVAAGLIAGLAAAPAAAQQRSQTVYEPVDRSLSDLLDDGWIVWTMARGEVGQAFLLENDGRFVLCEMRPRPLPAVSFCNRIN